jgi:DNA-binding transcriptional regulator GbsR (MarR family)
MQGWIKLHRKLLDWEWYSDSVVKDVFIHLLLTANHTDGKWRGQEVKAGSLITSIDNLARPLGLSVQQVRTAIKKLQSTGEIDKVSTNRNTMIIVVNYGLYQSLINDEQQSNNNQITTNKKVRSKECKECNNITTTIKACHEKLIAEYSELDREELWFDLPLSIAEYDYLCNHINEFDLDKYINKLGQYNNCKSAFDMILRWAINDCCYIKTEG